MGELAERCVLRRAIAFSAALLIGAAALSHAVEGVAVTPAKVKPCANTGTYVKPGGSVPKNSARTNPRKLFGHRPDPHDRDQERQIGETANLAGFTATVTDASAEQTSDPVENQAAVRVSIKICNRSDDPKTPTPVDWKLQSSLGPTISPQMTDASLAAFPVAPSLLRGEEQAGAVSFPVGTQRGEFYVVFEPLDAEFDPLNGPRGVWKVSI